MASAMTPNTSAASHTYQCYLHFSVNTWFREALCTCIKFKNRKLTNSRPHLASGSLPARNNAHVSQREVDQDSATSSLPATMRPLKPTVYDRWDRDPRYGLPQQPLQGSYTCTTRKTYNGMTRAKTWQHNYVLQKKRTLCIQS